jgi:hypothetical protein
MIIYVVADLPRRTAIALQLWSLCRAAQRPTLKKMHAIVCNSETFYLLEESIKGRAKLELLTHNYLRFQAVKSMNDFAE